MAPIPAGGLGTTVVPVGGIAGLQSGAFKVQGLSAAATVRQLHEWVKHVLICQLVRPGDSVFDLFCGRSADTPKWASAGISHYMGIDVTESALEDAQEEWAAFSRPFPASFCNFDPCLEELRAKLEEAGERVLRYDIVRCHEHLQDCFLTEATARRCLANAAAMLKPGGYFFGCCPDSSTLWHKFQKVVEAARVRGGPSQPVIKSPLYSILFDDVSPFDKGSVYGTKYLMRLADDDPHHLHHHLHLHPHHQHQGLPPQHHLLVHFPTFTR